ncbi:protein patched homolog 3-like [Amphiura filiformis]|uniref:protein patched homolog 3-like n=1 Tax=Amphiura filiformis TaxID=82378 RepID=UPI003B219EFA
MKELFIYYICNEAQAQAHLAQADPIVLGHEINKNYSWSNLTAGIWNQRQHVQIIRQELLRNLSLAATCIFLVVTVLLASIWASVLVFLCVIFTLVDIAGTLNLMGVTIDTVVSVPVILAVGIAIDYSVHICHAFLVLSGSRNARVKRALVDKGIAVFKGGMSSFLAFILLAFSRSYVYTTFFKIFLLIVIYGLFHGLAVLPVLLSFIGPVPYPTALPADPADYNKIIIRQNLRRRFFRERRCYSL